MFGTAVDWVESDTIHEEQRQRELNKRLHYCEVCGDKIEDSRMINKYGDTYHVDCFIEYVRDRWEVDNDGI